MPAQERGPAAPNATHRRGAARTAVVWEGLRSLLEDRAGTSGELRVLDIGGGTGGFAVRVAELGHRVTVVDPSPDALAILDRRSHESGVGERVTGIQGDLATVSQQVAGASIDVVLCHGVLEVVDDPVSAMRAITGVLRPDGALSLLVSQRHAAVVARAVAGQFEQARTLLRGDVGGTPHRFTAEETRELLTDAGFSDITLHAIRVFSDLVPSALVDLDPRAADALLALEQAVADRPEYLVLAIQIHAIARRG